MAEKTLTTNDGLINRVAGIFDLIRFFPDEMSDEEVDGLLHAVAPDTARTISAALTPRVRRAGIQLLRMIAAWFDGAQKARESGQKIILVPFNFPPEFVRCVGCFPLTSEVLTVAGAAALEGQGDRYWEHVMALGLPDYLCSANAIELGSVLTGIDFEPDAIISAAPGSCDANSKLHEFTARTLGIPQFLLEKPGDNERGHQTYLTYFKTLVKELEEWSGEKVDEEQMRSVLEKANKASDLFYEMMEMRAARPSPCPNLFTLFAYAARFTMWGTDEAIEMMQVMVDTVRERLNKGEYPNPDGEIARCFWTYTYYYWDWVSFFNNMEEKGITFVGDLLGSLIMQQVDTTSMETMFDGLARNCQDYCMTRQMGAESMSTQWIDDLVHWTTRLDADAMIFCGHHACKQTWSVFSITRNELMKRKKLPTLMLQGDAWLRGMTPMSALEDQIDEFVNNVVTKRKR